MENINMTNISGKKLSIIGLLIVAQFIFILIGELIAPQPTRIQTILDTACKDNHVDGSHGSGIWYYTRGKGNCEVVHLFTNNDDDDDDSNQNQFHHAVHTFEMPLSNNDIEVDYSKWEKNLIGLLKIDIVYHNQSQILSMTPIIMDVRLAYRNKGDSESDWKSYSSSEIVKTLNCPLNNKWDKGYVHNCDKIPLFELTSLYYEHYLLNIRLSFDTERNITQKFQYITDISLITINENGEFTKIWFSMKIIFFPIVLVFLIWYWRLVNKLLRSPTVVEYMLLSLGLTISFLNIPLEFSTAHFDMPFILILHDITQFIFYFMIRLFWLIFTNEHTNLQHGHQQNSLKYYRNYLAAVFVGSSCLFMISIYNRGAQTGYPFIFNSITTIDVNLELLFIIFTGLFSILYLLFLIKIVWTVFMEIKTVEILPSTNQAQELRYKGILYRFNFTSIATFLCASLTLLGFIFGQLVDSQWKRNENYELVTSKFFTAIYAMWNIYTISLLYLYAPLEKKQIINQQLDKVEDEHTINTTL